MSEQCGLNELPGTAFKPASFIVSLVGHGDRVAAHHDLRACVRGLRQHVSSTAGPGVSPAFGRGASLAAPRAQLSFPVLLHHADLGRQHVAQSLSAHPRGPHTRHVGNECYSLHFLIEDVRSSRIHKSYGGGRSPSTSF